MKLTAIAVTKFVTSGAVGIGTGKIVSGIIKNNVSPTKLIDKVTIAAASFMIGSMAAEATKKYSDNLIDEVVKVATGIKKSYEVAGSLARINAMASTWEDEGLDPNDFQRNPETDKWEPKPDEDETA